MTRDRQNNQGAEPEILYEDAHLVVVKKPAGWLSQSGADEKGNTMASDSRDMTVWLTEHERRVRRQPEGSDVYAHDPYIGVVHRLDRGVGGVMVYAKKPRAAAVLSDAVQKREMVKQYLCVVSGIPEACEGEYRDFLYKDAKQNKVYVVDRMRAGVREALLTYRVQQTRTIDGADYALLLVTLGTGRSHQIRAQLSAHGTPIVGDGKYGGHRPDALKGNIRDGDTYAIGEGEIALFSHHLAFAHPGNAPAAAKAGRQKKKRMGAQDDGKRFRDVDISCMPDADCLPWGWFFGTEPEKP